MLASLIYIHTSSLARNSTQYSPISGENTRFIHVRSVRDNFFSKMNEIECIMNEPPTTQMKNEPSHTSAWHKIPLLI